MIVQALVLDLYFIWLMLCMYSFDHTCLCFTPNRNWLFETQSVECDKYVLIIAFAFKWTSITLISWSFLIRKSICTEFCCWSDFLKVLILFRVLLVSCNHILPDLNISLYFQSSDWNELLASLCQLHEICQFFSYKLKVFFARDINISQHFWVAIRRGAL